MADGTQRTKESHILTMARISTIKLKNCVSQVNKDAIELCNLFDKRHADLLKLNRECTAIANEGERQNVTVCFNGDTQHRIRETKRGINTAIECLLKMRQSLEDTEEALVNNQVLRIMQTCLQANKSACTRTHAIVTKEAIHSSETETHATADVEGVEHEDNERGLSGHPEDVQTRDNIGRFERFERTGDYCDKVVDSGIGSVGSAICQPQSTCFEHDDLPDTVKSMRSLAFISVGKISSEEVSRDEH